MLFTTRSYSLAYKKRQATGTSPVAEDRERRDYNTIVEQDRIFRSSPRIARRTLKMARI